MRYFHGGVPGLKVGDKILPPDETGVKPAVAYVPEDDELDTSHVRTDRVFLGTTYDIALIYAAMHPEGGWIYEVEAIGGVEPDPDWHGEPGMSVQALGGVVVAVEPLSARTIASVQRQLMGWEVSA